MVTPIPESGGATPSLLYTIPQPSCSPHGASSLPSPSALLHPTPASNSPPQSPPPEDPMQQPSLRMPLSLPSLSALYQSPSARLPMPPFQSSRSPSPPPSPRVSPSQNSRPPSPQSSPRSSPLRDSPPPSPHTPFRPSFPLPDVHVPPKPPQNSPTPGATSLQLSPTSSASTPTSTIDQQAKTHLSTRGRKRKSVSAGDGQEEIGRKRAHIAGPSGGSPLSERTRTLSVRPKPRPIKPGGARDNASTASSIGVRASPGALNAHHLASSSLPIDAYSLMLLPPPRMPTPPPPPSITLLPPPHMPTPPPPPSIDANTLLPLHASTPAPPPSINANTLLPPHASTPAPPAPSLPPPIDVHTPPPSWFLSASEMLHSEPLGQPWNQAVSLWEAFEVSTGFPDTRRLPKLRARHRPVFVGDWIQRARISTYRPNIPDFDDAGEKFTTWWASLQPQWRVSDDGSLIRSCGSWEDLRRPGVNGLLSVLAALFFWGAAAGGKDSRWDEAVADVVWAFGEAIGSKEMD